MVILMNEENEETTEFEFNECKKEIVRVQGLGDGDYLMSEDPYYFQDENGYLIGLDNSFNELIIMNEQDEVIQTIKIDWITQCSNSIECSPYQEASRIDNYEKRNHHLEMIFMIIIFIIIIFMMRKFNR